MKLDMESYAHKYPSLCVRTMAQREDLDNNAHMALGMCGEFFSEVVPEVIFGKDKSKQIEEVGDFFWYIGCFCSVNDIPFEKSTKEPKNNLAKQLGILAERIKKEYAYKKDTGSFKELIQDIIFRSYQFCDEYNLDVEEILIKNIEKLKARYPDKFEEEKAISKNLSAEQEVFNNE